jgi:hypothetical protein
MHFSNQILDRLNAQQPNKFHDSRRSIANRRISSKGGLTYYAFLISPNSVRQFSTARTIDLNPELFKDFMQLPKIGGRSSEINDAVILFILFDFGALESPFYEGLAFEVLCVRITRVWRKLYCAPSNDHKSTTFGTNSMSSTYIALL